MKGKVPRCNGLKVTNVSLYSHKLTGKAIKCFETKTDISKGTDYTRNLSGWILHIQLPLGRPVGNHTCIATGLGVVRKHLLEQCCAHRHTHSPPYGNEQHELKGNLLVPIYWRAFPSWHQLGGSFPKSGKNQFTHSPGKTPSASKTTLHYTLNPPQAHFKT